MPKPRSDLKSNTPEFESLPLVKPTGFREYDARWLFPQEINLMGLNAVGLGMAALFDERGVNKRIVVGHDYRWYSGSVKQALMTGLLAGGFEVHDIGVDQSVEKFMAAADKCQPTIIGMSALLTTTMTYMKTVIDGFEAAGRGHIKMAVGGAPISQMFADEIGADGYGQNASAAVDLFLKLAKSQ